MRRTTTAVLLAALLALAGCSSSDSNKPAESTPSAAPSTPAELSAEEQVKACTEAIADGKDSTAPECADLSPDDYLKALQAANQQARDDLQDLSDAASKAAQP